MSMQAVRDALTALRAAHDALAATDVEDLTRTDLLEVLDEVQTLACQLPTQRHRLLAHLQRITTAKEVGAKSWRDVLMTRWRLSSQAAHRWLTDADLLAPRQSFTGEPLPPELPATAAATALGLLTDEHVTVIRLALRRLPAWVDLATRTQIEVDWVRHGLGCGPKELDEQTDRTLFLLDQDGPVPDDAERGRRRGITKKRQDPVGMTELKVILTPQAWAVWEVLLTRYAAPGMCNPADPQPCTHGTPTQAQIDADDRPHSQRCHDAFEFLGRHALDKGDLGSVNGLPTSILVRTTLQELQTRAGIGVTGGGTIIPISEVVAMAARADATHYLAVFDGATGSALNLYRSRRTASPAQRLALIARDGGCTKPGCTVPAYGAQAHHARQDWNAGGHTNVDDLGLACGCDNRSVAPDGWSTTLNEHHQVEWTPPPELDTGQHRINHYHHPERLHPPHTTWHPEHRRPGESDSGNVVDGEAVIEREVVLDSDTDTVPAPHTEGDEVVAKGEGTLPVSDGADDAEAGNDMDTIPEDDETATESRTSEIVTNRDEFEGEGTGAEIGAEVEVETAAADGSESAGDDAEIDSTSEDLEIEDDDTEYWWPVDEAPSTQTEGRETRVSATAKGYDTPAEDASDFAADHPTAKRDPGQPPPATNAPNVNRDQNVGEPGGPAPPKSSAA